MRIDHRVSRGTEDRNNVADQPGGAILFVGLALACVLGFTVRGLIHPTKIQALIEGAASRIHPDVRVRFQSAHVSLANGFFLPRFSVIIDQVHMESSNPCWMAPRLYADEIRLPISISAWLRGHSPVKTVEAGEVELRLTQARPVACDRGDVPPPRVTAESVSPQPVVSLVQRASSNPEPRSSGDLERLRIDRLSVISEAQPFVGSLDLEQMDFNVRSVKPRVYLLQARTRLLKDAALGDYLTTANIVAEYKEFPEKALDVRVFGNWREGSYDLGVNYDPDQDGVKIKTELRHLPLSQLIAVLRRFQLISTDFEPRQSWMSFHAEVDGPLKKIDQAPIRMSDFRIEGDLGEIAAPRIEIVSSRPFQLAPLQLDVQSLDLDRALQFLKRPHPTPILNHLGTFRGVVDVRAADDFRLTGEHSGLEFIFANKGRRELQTVHSIKGEIRREPRRWTFLIREAEVVQGRFSGHAKIEADANLENVQGVFNIDELLLRSGVQQLMTRGGEIGPLQGRVQFETAHGRLSKLKGLVKIPDARVEGASFERLSLQFEEHAGSVQITPKMDRLLLATNVDSPAWSFLQPVIPPSFVVENSFALAAVSGQIRFKDAREIQWTRLTARTEKPTGLTLSSDGGWTAQGFLEGRLSVRAPERSTAWKIEGTRDQPTLTETKP